ncbi:hypothetical protein C8R47DRAFT_1313774 [Mycena vitilis]|nr:hypothetical protein C8R47DRAFT_1313774 [Mycena vitilis]
MRKMRWLVVPLSSLGVLAIDLVTIFVLHSSHQAERLPSFQMSLLAARILKTPCPAQIRRAARPTVNQALLSTRRASDSAPAYSRRTDRPTACFVSLPNADQVSKCTLDMPRRFYLERIHRAIFASKGPRPLRHVSPFSSRLPTILQLDDVFVSAPGRRSTLALVLCLSPSSSTCLSSLSLPLPTLLALPPPAPHASPSVILIFHVPSPHYPCLPSCPSHQSFITPSPLVFHRPFTAEGLRLDCLPPSSPSSSARCPSDPSSFCPLSFPPSALTASLSPLSRLPLLVLDSLPPSFVLPPSPSSPSLSYDSLHSFSLLPSYPPFQSGSPHPPPLTTFPLFAFDAHLPFPTSSSTFASPSSFPAFHFLLPDPFATEHFDTLRIPSSLFRDLRI